jgi:hypothetical protein
MASRQFRLSAGLLALSVVAVALAGCSQAPTVSAPPPVSKLVVSPDGIAGLAVGHPVASSNLVSYGEHACPKSGGWLPRYSQDATNSSGQQLDPFDVDTKGARRGAPITDEFVWSKSIATAKGIHVGSSLAQVMAAYPRGTATSAYSTVVYAVPGAAGKLLIEVARRNDDAAGEWPAATLGTVVWMHVVPLHEKVESIAGGNDAGPCPVEGKDPGDTDDD